uniref:Deoxyribonuclease II n=1 Tax=Acrobeloides nanus TaxID=290746 RepID=A0A914EDB9_9BILA
MFKICIFLSIFYLINAQDKTFTCRDMNNNPVDWFIFYKLGKEPWSNVPNLANGSAFMYMDVNNVNWQFPQDISMYDTNHAIYYTLKQYYDNKADKDNTFYILYNDEWPANIGNGSIWSDDSGHQKGVSLFGRGGGYWLIHSIPKFPTNDTYGFPSNAHTYGQMGICLSLPYLQGANNTVTQLSYTYPFIYEISAGQSFLNDIPRINNLINRNFVTTPATSKVTFNTVDGREFYHYAKSGPWGKDLYADFVAIDLQTDLLVESWDHNASMNINSTCGRKYDVFDAKNVSLPFNVAFSTYWDHSKYAIAYDSAAYDSAGHPFPYMCVGDINRQLHQEVRGGGTMCFLNSTVFSTFGPIISEHYGCPKAGFLQTLKQYLPKFLRF